MFRFKSINYGLEEKNGKVFFSTADRQEILADFAPDFCEMLESYGYENIDTVALSEACSSSKGQSLVIATYKTRHARARIDVDPDCTRALVHVAAPDAEGAHISSDVIKKLLTLSKITHGIEESELARIVSEKVYNQDVTVATGRPVKHGEDGTVEYHFNTRPNATPNKGMDSGKVDHKELGMIEPCYKDQLLATLYPPTKPLPGITVHGEYVPADPGQKTRILKGKNTKLSEDETKLFSETDGHVTLKERLVVVSNVYVLNRDVDGKTGNIKFDGSVEINGNILEGFQVLATENITVSGTIGDAKVVAGGNISIKGGIVGKERGSVMAAGSIRTRFAEGARIKANGSLWVEDELLHSVVDVLGSVLVGVGPVLSRKQKGAIFGSKVIAGVEVNCMNLGADVSTTTDIYVGNHPTDIERYDELRKNLHPEKEKLGELQRSVLNAQKDLQRASDSLRQAAAQKLVELKAEFRAAGVQITKNLQEFQILRKRISVKVARRISASENAYPDVQLQIDKSMRRLSVKYSNTTFEREDRKIVPVTYRAPGNQADSLFNDKEGEK